MISSLLGMLPLWLFIPAFVSSLLFASFAGLITIPITRDRRNFLPVFLRGFIGAILGGLIGGFAWIAFLLIQGYVINNLAYRGQGMAYAILLTPAFTLVGSTIGGVISLATRRR